MTDGRNRPAMQAAFDKLRAELLHTAEQADLKEDSQIRKVIARTLEKLRADLDSDPGLLDDLLQDENGLTVRRDNDKTK